MTHRDSPHSKLKPGDRIVVSGFSRPAELLEGPNRKNQYLIQVGTLSMWVDMDRISAAPASLKRAKKSSGRAKPPRQTARTNSGVLNKCLDLHGMSTQEAVEKLEQCIDRAILDGVTRIEVIHGIGTGKVRAAVYKYLEGNRSISAFHFDDRNAGTTWVFL